MAMVWMDIGPNSRANLFSSSIDKQRNRYKIYVSLHKHGKYRATLITTNNFVEILWIFNVGVTLMLIYLFDSSNVIKSLS